MRRRRAALTLVVAAAAMVPLACGEDEGPEPATGPRTVSQEEIDNATGDPARAVLEWWRDVQFQNAAGALERYAPDVDLTVEELNRQLSIARSSFVGVPQIVDVRRSGDMATIYMTLLPPGSTAAERNLSLNLEEIDGEWLLRDNLLMTEAVARVARAGAAAED